MLKLKILFVFILVLCLGSSHVSEPVNGNLQDYSFIKNFDGVKAYWKVKYNDYSRGYAILYKLENTTSRCVTVKYRASFKCGADGKGENDSGAVFIQGYSTKEGEMNELYSYSYPCPSGVSPTRIELQAEVIPK